MKQLLVALSTLIFYFGAVASAIWAVVGFILFLVKDFPFNWWSIWLILICGVLSFVTFIVSLVFEKVEQKQKLDNVKDNWKKRIQEIQSKNAN